MGKRAQHRPKQFTMMELADMMGVDYAVVKRGREAVEAANSADLELFSSREILTNLLTYIDALHRGALSEDQYKALRAAERKDRK